MHITSLWTAISPSSLSGFDASSWPTSSEAPGPEGPAGPGPGQQETWGDQGDMDTTSIVYK